MQNNRNADRRTTMVVPVWLTPLGPETDTKFEAAWQKLTEGATPRAESIEMKGREVPVPALPDAGHFERRETGDENEASE